MSLIGVINSDPEIKVKIEKSFVKDHKKVFAFRHAHTEEEAMELLNFDLPEIVIINTSDGNLPLESISKSVHDDSWLHNFGIIALYDKRKTSENEVARMFKEINLLAIMDHNSITSNLFKNVTIIEKNRQIIFQWEMMNTLSNRITGSFIIDNDPLTVPVYAGLAATALVQRGYLSLDNKRNLQIALAELIQNGIEHGNCELTFEEKSKFLMEGGSIADLIAKKNTNPAISAKKVHLEWDIRREFTKFFVRDEGQGFNVAEYQEKLKTHKTDALHGRGILLARNFGGKLAYNRMGNCALLTVTHHSDTSKMAPMGFAGEEVLLPQKGDIIFRQGELSDHLFYISSGQYGVYHDDIAIGILTPADIFMGEMSFLLNNIRTATVVAETGGKIIKISRKTFINSIRQYPQYGLFLSKLLARKLMVNNKTTVQRRKEDFAT